MSWTAPRTWANDEFVTASMFNQQLRDNQGYLKGKFDLLASDEPTDVTTSRAIDTAGSRKIYQNTNAYSLWVQVQAYGAAASAAATVAYAYCDTSSTNPTTEVAYFTCTIYTSLPSTTALYTLTFIVPPNLYYRVKGSVDGDHSLLKWCEQPLF